MIAGLKQLALRVKAGGPRVIKEILAAARGTSPVSRLK